MFNFIKKKLDANQSETISVDEQIHRDVYSAQDRLLAEAKEILSKSVDYDEERHARLKALAALGFTNAAEVKEFNQMDTERLRMQRLAYKIEYYQQRYPLHKFIPVDAVEAICKKYGLILTRVRNYIAEIPEKNQKEIVDFRVKRGDTRSPSELRTGEGFYMPLYLNESYREYVEKESEIIPGEDLLIVAPEYKIDMKGKVREGHVLKIDDPIVLQPVDKGYLIVTSWGLEAADELVVNPNKN